MKIFADAIKNYLVVVIATTFLFLTTAYFYKQIGNSQGVFGSYITAVLFLSAITDAFILLMHVFRREVAHRELSFDPKKITIIIACYNGEKVIAETIRQCLVHVEPAQIFVVSDKSIDRTVEVAESSGVRVFSNVKNINKALSISGVIQHVETPYILLLDDDTHIEKTLIPTSLLDQGYSAVAFNVMPEKSDTLVNKFQQFEYRSSMLIGKSLVASVGAISNVSGAIGLFRREDLLAQVTMHSGQFGGEDQQRTMLVHLNSKGYGVTYTDAAVFTVPPQTFGQLFRQRAYSWNCSTEETFMLCVKILFHPDTHLLLKLEKAYLIFIFFTDPLRMLFWVFLFLHPVNLIILYLFYVLIETIAWNKMGRYDPYYIVLLFPLYGVLRTLSRFIAHFWWFKLKYDYIRKNLHVGITERNLIMEYLSVSLIIVGLWVWVGHQFYVYASDTFLRSYIPVSEDEPLLPSVAAEVTGPVVVPTIFTENRYRNSVHEDIQSLQHFLNTHGYPVAIAGNGSLGKETAYFGPLTGRALVKFQIANNLPATGVLDQQTRDYIKLYTSLQER